MLDLYLDGKWHHGGVKNFSSIKVAPGAMAGQGCNLPESGGKASFHPRRGGGERALTVGRTH